MIAMEYENIIVERKSNIAYVTINRPEVRNALNQQTLNEISHSLAELEQDDNVKCIVFTGAGGKSFAAGADIGQLKTRTFLDAFQPGNMQQVYDKIEACKKPTIAMINGYALGGGCELAMACDIRVASTNAKLGLPELNLAIMPGAGGTQRLARIVGKGKALEMILTGKIIDAEEAKMIGLVSEVVSPDELVAKTEEIAEKIMSKGPLAVMLAKLAVHHGADADLKTGLLIEKLSQAVLYESEDKQEGTAAFLEKRQANFKGR